MKSLIAFNIKLPEMAKLIPEWIELIPAGEEVPGRDGRKWKNDNPDGIIQAFLDDKKDIQIDIEHASELKASKGEEALAYGWIKELKKRQDSSIWGRVEWTNRGKWALEDKSYRYISPVFTYYKNTTRILKLESVGLTNQPNLYLTALNGQNKKEGEDNMPIPKSICDAVSLGGNATEGDIVLAINTMKTNTETAMSRAKTPDPEKFVPKGDHALALNRAEEAEKSLKEINEKQHEKEVETAINQALKAGKIAPTSVEYHTATCRDEAGLKRFKEYAEKAPEIMTDVAFNRENIEDGKTDVSTEDLTKYV